MNALKLILLSGLLAVNASAWAQADDPIANELRQLLATDNLVIEDEEILARDIIRDMYEDNGFNPYWTDESDIQELLQLIEQSPDHGLRPEDYAVDQLKFILAERRKNPSAKIAAEADIMLSESLMRYGYQRRLGKVKASNFDENINFKRRAFRGQPPSNTMEEFFTAPSLEGFIETVAPSGPYYRRLQAALKRYRHLAANGGWPTVSEGPTLRLGDNGPRVAEIRARLAVSGDLPERADTNSTKYDEALEEAVIHFQNRHSLGADGVVGKQSIAAMNVPIGQRIEQIRVSLERLRWVNQEAEETMVAVNIAGYRAFFFRDGEMKWSTKAMVGKTYRKTPVFRGDMQYIEFNPTWTIPPGIIRNDTLPAIKKNPDYLASKNIRVIDKNGKTIDPASVDWNQYSRGVPYTLRQDPGPNNALGTVKFIFPNSHFVFLHDTPHRELFSQPERAFSSGCIRVQDPLRLAELILDDDQYQRSDLEAIIDGRETKRVHLDNTIPVVILYLTAGIDTDGDVLFFKDVYGRDQRVLNALNGEVVIDPPETGS